MLQNSHVGFGTFFSLSVVSDSLCGRFFIRDHIVFSHLVQEKAKKDANLEPKVL